jgi:hypothetical protein
MKTVRSRGGKTTVADARRGEITRANEYPHIRFTVPAF